MTNKKLHYLNVCLLSVVVNRITRTDDNYNSYYSHYLRAICAIKVTTITTAAVSISAVRPADGFGSTASRRVRACAVYRIGNPCTCVRARGSFEVRSHSRFPLPSCVEPRNDAWKRWACEKTTSDCSRGRHIVFQFPQAPTPIKSLVNK